MPRGAAQIRRGRNSAIGAAASVVPVWQSSWLIRILVAVAAGLICVLFWQGLLDMRIHWGQEEYSHGYLMPFIVCFLIWQKSDVLSRFEFDGTWTGLIIVVFGLFILLAGELSTLYSVIQYGFFVTAAGVVLAWLGWRAFGVIAVPLLISIFMIPLPDFLYNNLSSYLQLISSEMGVSFIRAAGISVFLEGNVIDLGSMRLQVVEACSGLRYLFPLMTLAFIVAYFYKGAFWKRVIIFLSSIPITILMNSFRIGLIGMTVEYWGPEAADGVLHDFEGWVVFMASFGVLLLLMWTLTLVPPEGKPLREVFGLDFPAPIPPDTPRRNRRLPAPFLASLVVLMAATVAVQTLPERKEIVPDRAYFADFPLQLSDWSADVGQLDQIYVDALKFEDYFLADYSNPKGDLVNVYVAYYESQRKGASVHSPRSCIPGGGWRITDLSQRSIDGVEASGKPLRVNRVQIELEDTKQLVYYWFQQRGRILTNEYLVKWYLFWDALTRSRTDGALVRLTAAVRPGQDIAAVDMQLTEMVRLAFPPLDRYIPE